MAAGPTRCWTGSRGGSGGSSTGGSGGRGGQTARGARVHTGFGLACGPGGVIVLVRRLVAGGPRLDLRLPRLLDLGPELRAYSSPAAAAWRGWRAPPLARASGPAANEGSSGHLSSR